MPELNSETLTLMKESAAKALKLRPGQWCVHDSCSWRRIGTAEPYGDGDVLCPTTQRDGHPDLQAERDVLDHIAAASATNVGALIAEYERLARENERLREGRFTEEEFQNLCHNTVVQDGFEAFADGCDAYQQKMFGRCRTKGSVL